MTDPQNTESGKSASGAGPGGSSQNELADQLRALGENIKNFLHALWESQESKRVKQEIESGVSSLGSSLNRAARELQESPTGQRVKEEFDEIGERIRKGEVEATLRRDFVSALRTANTELEKVLDKLSTAEKTEPGSGSGSPPEAGPKP